MPGPTPTCARCGTPVPAGARACSSCGADVSGQQGQVATAFVAPDEAGTMTLAGAGLLDALRRATTGDYDVGGELGAGGMATVFLAHDLALGRKVAIKVMAPHLVAMPGMVERFKREARTAASLSHPHIIPIFAVKQSAEIVYFVMKYVEGRSLESIVKAAGVLPVPLVLTVLYQAAAALGASHKAGVVHRDVKPANIMVDKDGWVVVTDFGIAKVAETTGLTMTGATIGTPSYMSPEQCEAKRELTGASDQYSLGIVAYEMLTGRPPFRAETTLGLLFAHVHEPPPPLGPDIPAPVAAALMRMLAKNPAQRFPDVEAAIAALGGVPVANDDPVREQLRQLARAGADDDVKRIARTPVSPLPATRAPTAPAPARPPSPPVGRTRRSRALWAVPVVAVLAIGAVGVVIMRRSNAPGPPSPPPTSRPEPLSIARPETVRIEVPVPAAPTPPAAPTLSRDSALPAADTPAPPRTADRGSPADARVRRRFAASQVAALGLRARARNRGADVAALQAGDVIARRADSLARAGDYAAAAAELRSAQQQWAEAERAAGGTVQSFRSPAPTPVSERSEVEAAIAAFSAAFRSRDLSRVRRTYPGMTPAQAQEWGTFFLDARNLDVRLDVTGFDLRGDEVAAEVTGGLDWESLKTGRAESRTVSYRATLMRDKTGWRLTSLR